MFPRPQQLVFISQLSGGERKRLHLLSVLIQNPNFLILDEPTNDLDLLTLNVLESYLQQFPGCLVIVSHDRFFMDKLVDHMFIMDGHGNTKDYNGTYSEWKKSSAQNFFKPPAVSDNGDKVKGKVKNTSKLIETAVRKLIYLEKKELQQLEKEIDTLEDEKKTIEKDFLQSNLKAIQIEKMSIRLGIIKAEIETREMYWLELSEFL
jgi:ATP-binding cassette subfamily F protein uup